MIFPLSLYSFSFSIFYSHTLTDNFNNQILQNRISVGQDFSHKDQKMIKCEKRHDTVATHLYRLIRFSLVDRVFQELVLKPLGIAKILDKRIKEVSQSTLQKIAIATCLGQVAHLVS